MCQSPSTPLDFENLSNDNLSDEETEEYNEEGENSICIRAKWTIDGAKTIDEAIELLNEFIRHLKYLKEEGWELRDEISDDYGHLYKTPLVNN